jgi:nucleotide-binding universal stress UspA family protein
MAFTRILVPTDFSPNAKEAACMAVDVAKRYDASLCFIHVFQSVAYLLPEGFVMQNTVQLPDILGDLEKRVRSEKADAERGGVQRVEAELVEGVPATEIVRYAKDKRCDLIVMGTHGRTGITHALMGSIAEKVVRTSECPVLTLRDLGERPAGLTPAGV